MTVLQRLSVLAALPATLAHEATHAALTAPHADDWRVALDTRSGAAAVIVEEWGDAPRWGIVLAHLGPLLCGIILGTVALLYIATAGYDPQGYDWLKVSVLAVWWGIYTAPSGGDLAVLDGGDDDAAE
jgi:hypothetical protein